MMTRSKGRQSRKWSIQVVHIGEPDITSPAALCLLAKKYVAADKSIYTEFRMHRIRNKWMKKQMRTNMDEEGGLTCAHCKRKGLSPRATDDNMRAVLDHRIEICLGGAWNDPDNFQVLCDRCNCQKNDRLQKLQVPA